MRRGGAPMLFVERRNIMFCNAIFWIYTYFQFATDPSENKATSQAYENLSSIEYADSNSMLAILYGIP